MLKVVIFGAGKSSSYLIKKLQEISTEISLHITLIDQNWEQLPNDCKNHSNTTYTLLNINNTEKIKNIIKLQNLVISMLPAQLHISIAKICIDLKKNMLTASYVSKQMQELHLQAKESNLLFLNEIGVDPGLDHMSAMVLLNSLKKRGAIINSFYSHTGGLISKTTPNNWNYKFTWNPKNVITAGAEGAIFLKNEKKTNIDYNSVFTEITPVKLGNQNYDSYPNRNSLNYIKKYDLSNIENLYRGTLRYEGYCDAWNVFVQLGMTNDSKIVTFPASTSRKQFLSYFLNKSSEVETSFCEVFNINKESPIFKKIETLDFFNDTKIVAITKGTAADMLLSILKEDWKMQENDTDVLLMQHEIKYTLNNVNYKTTSELSVLGKDQQYTAMAKTVGVPMFEATLLMLQNKINLTGVHIPTKPIIFQPILNKLKNHGLKFIDQTTKV